ncbi:CidA/LrgA family protein [Bacillus sp. FJAT-45037]|uniref:CidA/LrgA family protein n=1 Tax=Bacillus sp. FJAT-45037 TaxID=2011007 RepID=UPI000C24DED9|nr:CidA/LrgA family protein [Bacillus sp. FJAT-45037]
MNKALQLLQLILHIGILYGFYIIGTWVQSVFDLIIPGSIIGMLLLFLLLFANILPVSLIENGTNLLIRHMPLLFVPFTVGILGYLDVFNGDGFWLILVTIFSTIVVFVLSGIMAQWLVNRKEQADD